jgi:hypothetical protein
MIFMRKSAIYNSFIAASLPISTLSVCAAGFLRKENIPLNSNRTPSCSLAVSPIASLPDVALKVI